MAPDVEISREPNATAKRAELASLLRQAASRVSAFSGGATMVFLQGESSTSAELRAAAGVDTPELARTAAKHWLPSLDQTLAGNVAQTLPPSGINGITDAAGALLVPIPGVSGCQGVFAAALPNATPGIEGLLALVAEGLGASLDAISLRGELNHQQRTSDEQSDEVLRLSEALFSQDIELLRKDERLGQIERLKNDFIEKMSRELRTPLNSIIEAIIAVLAGENDVLSDNAKSGLRLALDEGTAFLRTLQNILDLWRIKQNEMPLATQDVNFREVVEEAIFSVQDTVGDKTVKIEKHFEEPLPKIKTDLAKVNQVLFLLLDNAAKFTDHGQISIAARIEEGALCFEVRDTGIGICPDDQQFVFDEFFQVDDLQSTKYRGAGLGLSLVRDLVGLLDGSIQMRSEVGEGSAFAVRIPIETL